MFKLIIYVNDMNYTVDNVIKQALVNYDINYRMHRISGLNEILVDSQHDRKIYILDLHDGMKVLRLAREIRERDFGCVIIFINSTPRFQRIALRRRLLVFDFIFKNEFYEDRLKNAIIDAIRIIYKQEFFVFQYNHKVYRLRYNDINYIEKEPLIKRCIIHAVDNSFYIVNSIDKLEKILGILFVRTHQSCLVNINNIEIFDQVNNVIIFRNGDMTNLITDKMKKELRDKIFNKSM